MYRNLMHIRLYKQLNDELSAKGYITVAGRISRQYFNERVLRSRKERDIMPAYKKQR